MAAETSGGALPELQDACPGPRASCEEVGELEERNCLRRSVYQVWFRFNDAFKFLVSVPTYYRLLFHLT